MLTQEDLMAIAAMLEPIKEQLKELEPIKEQLKELDKKNLDTRAIIETQIQDSIRLLAEGHQQIASSMLKPEHLKDVRPRISVLEDVVKIHSEQLHELQKKIS